MSSNAATQVAGTYELAQHIFKDAQLEFGNSSLVAATTSDRFLGSVALDVLWETQTSLLPLFQVLGHLFEVEVEERAVWDSDEERWDDYAEPDRQRAMHLVDALTPADWEKLQSYARRIKYIEDGPLSPGDPNDVHFGRAESFEGIFNAGKGSVLLPNIRRFDIGPRMISLFEQFDFWPEKGKNAHLTLRDQACRPRPLYSIRFCRLSQLQMLGIEADYHLEMLPGLRAMPALEELHLKYKPETSNPDLKRWYEGDAHDAYGLIGRQIKAAPAPGFPALKTLRLTDAESIEDFTTTLKNMVKGSLKLEQLHIRGWEIQEFRDRQASKKLHAAIRASCDKATLTHLTIVLQSWRSGLSTVEMIQDLLTFPNITHACIDFDGHHYLDTKGAFDAITNAWCRLERLTFYPRPSRDCDAMLNLENLTCLADRCPRLSYLSIPINLTAVSEPVISTSPPLTDRSVSLNLGRHENLSRMSRGDTAAIAQTLASVFPYPTLASVTYDLHDAAPPPWHDYSEERQLPALATFDDPAGPRRKQWLSKEDMRRILGIAQPKTVAAKSRTKRSVKPPKVTPTTKTKAAAPRKPATTAAAAPAKTTDGEPQNASNTAAKQAAAGRKADTPGAKAVARARKPAAQPPTIDPARPLASFYDAGGHCLRAKRSTPPEVSQNRLATKRQRPQAAKVLGRLTKIEVQGRSVWNPDGLRWEEDEVDYQRVIRLKRGRNSVKRKDWARLQVYARRIKVIDDRDMPFRPGKVDDLHLCSESVIEIYRAGGGALLLPNLLRADIGAHLITLFEFFNFWPDKGDDGHAYLALRSWNMPHGHDVALCRLDQLRMLGIQVDNNLAMLPLLRAMPALEELHLKFEPEETNPDKKMCHVKEDAWDAWGLKGRKILADPGPGFHALKTLHLTDAWCFDDNITTLKNMIAGPMKLEGLHIRGWESIESPEERAVKRMYSTIGAFCDRTALTHLTVVFQAYQHPTRTQEIIKDLLVFPNITHAYFHTHGEHVDLNLALDVFSVAWPHLESLTFFCRPESTIYTDAVELATLACLVDRCPRLSYLSAPVSLYTIPRPVAPPAPSLLNRSVALNLGRGYDLSEEPQAVVRAAAKFLASIFPYPTLTSVTYDLEVEDEDEDDPIHYPTLALYDDPSSPLRRQWLSAEDFRRILRIPRAGTAKATKQESAAKSARGKRGRKAKTRARKTAADKATTAADSALQDPPSADVPTARAAKTTTAAARANTALPEASSSRSKVAPQPEASESTLQIASFYDAGGHRLRAKRFTPSDGSEIQLPAKRRRISALSS
ncbi:uncharacterized protein SCHCODRAFT_02593046 [Schizophyllum commune H4-8]|uniref:Uncharacterized protein n=1 Tax=Schizophyllum commune (strain H4-8 / FGSC 9210) TaxID=578458 RepID=D8QIX2_SCHCM|nr:uncharacterized protein SCHCODRAFT_02593046 [Schizophyllum commune H4-8]KAI5886200.1 hypothetical protein SCHCODRAFT_02593046 [Schizophyllum commune H4-8]